MVTEEEQKQVVRGLTRAVKKIIKDIDLAKNNYKTLREALFAYLDKKSMGVIKSVEKREGKDKADELFVCGLEKAGVTTALSEFVVDKLGISMQDLKAITETMVQRSQYYNLLTELSTRSNVPKTSLILMMDYSKGIEERMSVLKETLDDLKKYTEV